MTHTATALVGVNPTGPCLATEGLDVGYGGEPVIGNLSLEIPSGKVVVVIGPNGCGKSTLIRCLGRLLTPQTGRVLLHGEDIARIDTVEIARRISILGQSPEAPEDMVVRDLVARGRHPHRRWMQRWTDADEDAVIQALVATSLEKQQETPVATLSGGQRQRAWIAMTLAQGATTMLLDEPTNHLDIAHQLEILGLLRTLNRERGHSIILVLHDLNLAARIADQVVMMQGGRVVAQGDPPEVFTVEQLEQTFRIKARIEWQEEIQSLTITPLLAY